LRNIMPFRRVMCKLFCGISAQEQAALFNDKAVVWELPLEKKYGKIDNICGYNL